MSEKWSSGSIKWNKIWSKEASLDKIQVYFPFKRFHFQKRKAVLSIKSDKMFHKMLNKERSPRLRKRDYNRITMYRAPKAKNNFNSRNGQFKLFKCRQTWNKIWSNVLKISWSLELKHGPHCQNISKTINHYKHCFL